MTSIGWLTLLWEAIGGVAGACSLCSDWLDRTGEISGLLIPLWLYWIRTWQRHWEPKCELATTSWPWYWGIAIVRGVKINYQAACCVIIILEIDWRTPRGIGSLWRQTSELRVVESSFLRYIDELHAALGPCEDRILSCVLWYHHSWDILMNSTGH
jgi:hypothetical protein